MALVQETSLARIRHRALLDVLSDGFTVERYFTRFVELYKRDFQPLSYRMLITPTGFAQRFGEWLDQTDQYYSTFFPPDQAKPAAPAANATKKRTARRSARS